MQFYLLIFNFNKNKEYKKEEVLIEGKEIFEVFVQKFKHLENYKQKA